MWNPSLSQIQPGYPQGLSFTGWGLRGKDLEIQSKKSVNIIPGLQAEVNPSQTVPILSLTYKQEVQLVHSVGQSNATSLVYIFQELGMFQRLWN